MTQANSTLFPPQPTEIQPVWSLLRNRLLYPVTSSACQCFTVLVLPDYFSCSKPQDAKVADDQQNVLLNAEVNQPLIPGHSWVPIIHTDEYQAI